MGICAGKPECQLCTRNIKKFLLDIVQTLKIKQVRKRYSSCPHEKSTAFWELHIEPPEHLKPHLPPAVRGVRSAITPSAFRNHTTQNPC